LWSRSCLVEADRQPSGSPRHAPALVSVAQLRHAVPQPTDATYPHTQPSSRTLRSRSIPASGPLSRDRPRLIPSLAPHALWHPGNRRHRLPHQAVKLAPILGNVQHLIIPAPPQIRPNGCPPIHLSLGHARLRLGRRLKRCFDPVQVVEPPFAFSYLGRS
jgi:hypothetical protein